jgi:hypothetical protein
MMDPSLNGPTQGCILAPGIGECGLIVIVGARRAALLIWAPRFDRDGSGAPLPDHLTKAGSR